MSTSGYYRFPSIHKNTVVFVSEDDLWEISADGGVARRLTANQGAISYPVFSPDGKHIAFTGREEGHAEVYIMDARGGPVRRLTYLGVTSTVIGWTPDGDSILFSSDAAQPFDRLGVVYAVRVEGGLPEKWPIGPAVSASVRAGGQTVIGRNNNDPARWKRYRGGTAGDIWIDNEGNGQFRRLIQLEGNVARPMWIGDRVFFLSDHEGVGNLYSCTPQGGDLRRHTSGRDYYVRFPSTDGERIVYHAGADLYVYDPRTDEDRAIAVDYPSPRVQRQRRFVDASRYLETVTLHPHGHSLALNCRGKSFTMGAWEGAVLPQSSDASGLSRQRLTRWLNDGERVVLVSDTGTSDVLEIHSVGERKEPTRLNGLDIGRPDTLFVSPTHDEVALTNHRNELIVVDLVEKTARVVDQSRFGHVAGIDWSPDGRWIAYGFPITQYSTALKLWDRSAAQSHVITQPVLHDFSPAFDPEGKYLYFLSQRELNPVYDQLHFDLSFPRGMRPYLITLRQDLTSPFVPVPRPLQELPRKDPRHAEPTPEEEATGEAQRAYTTPAEPIKVDLENIVQRVVPFPVPEGIYTQIAAIKNKALFVSMPVEGAIREHRPDDPQGRGVLECYDFKELKHEVLVSGVSLFDVSRDKKALVYRSARRVRLVRAGEKPEEKGAQEGATRRTGWIDLGRIKVSVDPGVEWQQMAREAWRLQREYFWTENMSHVDWDAVWERYAPLVERVGTRGEFSDLMWEMQGELGTSHAYEFGGDYRPEPVYPEGFLGADFSYDPVDGTYTFARIIDGAPGEPKNNSPLRMPGINIHAGDRLMAINGRPVGGPVTPQELLVHLADTEVLITVETQEGVRRNVTVRTLRSEFPARYREWVESNRRHVHEATGGKIGYVHIPDMGANGYAEFHRLYLAEVDYDGLIVDVRFNRGGHVSQLLIEKLTRKPVGYDVQRWGQPEPYPNFAIAGPLVALTNQWAGSDGDIFSHVFKLMKLGPLIGKRTWGGVIGIWPRNQLADGTITTQPEFSFWFQDVGWGVENYGTDPDIDVDVAPQDYARGYDPQLERAIQSALEALQTNPPIKPAFGNRPNLALKPGF